MDILFTSPFYRGGNCTRQYAIMVTINIKTSKLFNSGILSIVRFLADCILFISNLFTAHLDPLENPFFELLVVENLLTLLIRFYRQTIC